MRNLKDFKYYAPDYPRTRHLPFQANAKRDDLVASSQEAKIVFERSEIDVTEKIDGASCRMTMIEGQPLIGNRNHILDKSYASTKRKNASKMQFAPIWNWWYTHKECFEFLSSKGPYTVYGDWMYMAHGMIYDNLPSLFMCYDLFDYEKQIFIDTLDARIILKDCGFHCVPLLKYGCLDSYEELAELCNMESQFSYEKREGVYVKVSSGGAVTERFKMVRPDFSQGSLLNQTRIIRNNVKIN
jgi:ATP-dependent RNA circularization protein (DNA/RNA ligase family)